MPVLPPLHHPISPAQRIVLELLVSEGEASRARLVKRSGYAPTTVSDALRGLRRRGLVVLAWRRWLAAA